MIRGLVRRFAGGLRFPTLLALGTLLVGSLRKRRETVPTAAQEPGPAAGL